MRQSTILVLGALAAPLAHAAPLAFTWQGRLLNADGAPIHGTQPVVLRLHDAASGGSVVYAATHDVVFEDGFGAVTLSGPGTVGTLEAAFDGADEAALWLSVEVDGAALGERTRLSVAPYAARAERAAGVVLVDLQAGTGCDTVGGLAYDVAQGLVACDGLQWRPVGRVTIVSTGAYRRWSDGTLAASCDAYRNPPSGWFYEGDVGDGVYRVDPDGDGLGIDVFCDMTDTGEGWTLILKTAANSATFQYTSAYWSNTTALNDTAPSAAAGDFKSAAYATVPFTRIRGCVTSTSNCLSHTFSAALPSALALFNGTKRLEGPSQASFYTVFGPSGYQSCAPNQLGFNVVNTDNNAYRWGFANNVPSQACQTSIGDDTDGVIGWGLRGQDIGATGAGWTNYFVSDTENGPAYRSFNSWIFVR